MIFEINVFCYLILDFKQRQAARRTVVNLPKNLTKNRKSFQIWTKLSMEGFSKSLITNPKSKFENSK